MESEASDAERQRVFEMMMRGSAGTFHDLHVRYINSDPDIPELKSDDPQLMFHAMTPVDIPAGFKPIIGEREMPQSYAVGPDIIYHNVAPRLAVMRQPDQPIPELSRLVWRQISAMINHKGHRSIFFPGGLLLVVQVTEEKVFAITQLWKDIPSWSEKIPESLIKKVIYEKSLLEIELKVMNLLNKIVSHETNFRREWEQEHGKLDTDMPMLSELDIENPTEFLEKWKRV